MISWIIRYYSLAKLTYKTNHQTSQICITLFYNTKIIKEKSKKFWPGNQKKPGSFMIPRVLFRVRKVIWLLATQCEQCSLVTAWVYLGDLGSSQVLGSLAWVVWEFAGLLVFYSHYFSRGLIWLVNESTALQVFYHRPKWEPRQSQPISINWFWGSSCCSYSAFLS